MKKHKIQGKIEFERLKIWSCHTFKQQANRPDCKIESYYTTGTQKKADCFSVDGYCNHCKTVFEAMGCYFHLCPCQEARPSLTDDEIKRGTRKRE